MDAKSNRILLSPDDIELNDHITIHSSKLGDAPMQGMGMLFQVKAINLPYICCHSWTPFGASPCVLDTRYMNLMRVNNEFIVAMGKPIETVQT